jgi:FHA domain-containing protein
MMLMLVGFALAESVVERSWRKALTRLAIVIPLGIIFGWVFEMVASMIYGIGLQIIFSMGVQTPRNPAWWLARGLGWMVFGIAGGLVYGLVGKSSKKGKYGVIGGVIGAGIGGLLFDPIAMAVDNAVWSRAVGFALFGLATGAAMGFVESALKDRWLYVSAGPLAGKQFILYKPLTTIGSQQQCDIYLFKDSSIAPQQATIELRGTQAYFRSITPVYVAGMPTQSKVLLSGEAIQIGRYSFRYNERHRS